jgi:dTDP-4-dehydrorhamnose reductase
VFDGQARQPRVESDVPAPLNVYGRSKAIAERDVQAAWPRAMVVRTSAFFGPWDFHNFITRALAALARGEEVHAATDVRISPTYVPDLVNVCLDLLIDGEAGIWHLANEGDVSWAELAERAASVAGLSAATLRGNPSNRLGELARRPAYAVLTSERATLMPTLGDALARFCAERVSAPVPPLQRRGDLADDARHARC